MSRQPDPKTSRPKARNEAYKIPDPFGSFKLVLGIIVFFALIGIGIATGIIPATESSGDPGLYPEFPDTSGH